MFGASGTDLKRIMKIDTGFATFRRHLQVQGHQGDTLSGQGVAVGGVAVAVTGGADRTQGSLLSPFL
jgi:hypothetical protein